MTTVTPDDVAIEMKLDGASWTDVSADVVGTIYCRYGIFGNGPRDRVASTGKLTIAMDNSDNNSAGLQGYYSPSNANARSGFDDGLPVRLKVEYDGETRYKFYGVVPPNGINVVPGDYGQQETIVTVEDWLGLAAAHELELPSLDTNKAIEDVVADIVSNMDISPQSTQYGTGQDTFPTVFDTTRSKTRALSEIAKVTRSEFGYVYRIGNDSDGETLVVDGRHTRSDTSSSFVLPVGSSSSDKLLLETGDRLLLESGDNLLLNQTQSASFTNTMIGMNVSRGKHLSNRVKVTTYPRDVDSVAVVLFSSAQAIQIEPGETLFLRGSYKDPDGAATRVAGKDMVSPVASTDYVMNTASDGSGSDITADLDVDPEYGASDVSYELTNNNASTGYITTLQARGKGIYLYDSVERVSEDSTSISDIGARVTRFDMQYQDDPVQGKSFADVILERDKDPRTTVDSITFAANRDDKHMAAFLLMEPGDRFTASETVSGVSGDYFINAMEFVIDGNIIDFTWYPTLARDSTYWQLGETGASELGETTYLGW